MRQIQKATEPATLREWRAAYKSDENYGYKLIDTALRAEIRNALIREQKGLCAYTGRRITDASSHIEHLFPQAHCGKDEETSFSNMVACCPAPNAPFLDYGAHRKGAWPDTTQRHLFVSPLSGGCTTRFSFNLRGEMAATTPTDNAANETILRLALNHGALNELREAAIRGTLERHGHGPRSLRVKDARQRLAALKASEENNGTLEPFSFVLVQALEKHILTLEAIGASIRARSERT